MPRKDRRRRSGVGAPFPAADFRFAKSTAEPHSPLRSMDDTDATRRRSIWKPNWAEMLGEGYKEIFKILLVGALGFLRYETHSVFHRSLEIIFKIESNQP
jgi:hypothetical protein